MPTGIYTFANIQSDVANEVHGTITDANYVRIINRAVKATLGDVDLRSTKRKSTLSPSVTPGQFDYALPADVKGLGIVDVRRQVNRSEKFELLMEEEFDIRKSNETGIFTVADADFSRLLRISSGDSDNTKVLHNCDSITANGTWVASTDASNITVDTNQYVQGNSSLNFDTASGATTAVLENASMTAVDLTGYELGDIFCWVYLPNTTTATNFILRIGNDSSNYWSKTVTTNNEGVAFYAGWNLLRFSLASATQTGTVAMATIDYLRLTITKDVGDAAVTDWRLDYFVARLGNIHSLVYYSKYLWQNTSGTYLLDSTATTDYINVDAEEYGIILDKCVQFAAKKLDNQDDVNDARKNYVDDVTAYIARYPSEAKYISSSYQDV